MKKYLIPIIVCAFAVLAFADTTLTIVIPTADEARVAEAFGSILNLGGPAAAGDIQGAITVWLMNQTTDYEKRKNMATFSPPPLTLGSPIELPPPSPGIKAAPTPKTKKKK